MPREAFRHLSVSAVVAIHDVAIKAHGGSPGLRDAALLESAIGAPQASFGGEPLMRDAVEIAAAYLFYLCRNHPFVDGNKRTALGACLIFLESNGLLRDPAAPSRDTDAWEKLVLDVAATRVDRDQTTRRLRRLLAGRPRRPAKKNVSQR